MKVGVRQETLLGWARHHEEFAEALGVCTAIQEHVLINMGLLRGYVLSVTIFLLKNLLGGKDPGEQVPERVVVVRLDAQDAETIGESLPDAEKGLPTAAERIEARRIPFAGKVGRPSKYRPDHHPEDIVAYFRASLDALEAPERVESRHGGVKYVQAPVRPPTLAGYAAKVGVRRETLWAWARQHEEFDEAVGICKAIQEHVFINMGLLGAWRPGMTIFVLKNLLRWQDKIERAHRGHVTLLLDAQDANA